MRSIYDEHGKAMLFYATRLTGNVAAAEDAVQEALVRAWRNSESMANGRGSVRGWLLTVVRNIVIDTVRARRARPTELPELEDGGPMTDDHADQVVDSVVVLDALAQLSADHRAVLRTLYYERQTVREAAVTLGIPEGTVKSRSYHALRALRDVMPSLEGAG
ncbi:RNA polymerase sigma-70 factor (ECF subfamily) [Actinophytocola oryzae]|uniref:RNA polymerase sigma-70 factor (ECF subfamily) n=1 Tax=Actinophytocola oryzae TaxID=502181 RepID=A0A4V3FQE6_9PSEU|nr:RNA polymerase sigma-70 factor (ECF subfamily) [Actinophytocola oryzae]